MFGFILFHVVKSLDSFLPCIAMAHTKQVNQLSFGKVRGSFALAICIVLYADGGPFEGGGRKLSGFIKL